MRRIAVDETMCQASGMIAVRTLSITAADQTLTGIEVYSGDEHYVITADTFAALDAIPVAGK